MYSLVLMTAMTTAPDTPEFNGYFRDLLFGNRGCYGTNLAPRYSCFGGCNGTANYSCTGSAAYPVGCSGSFYNGCNGCNGDTFLSRVRRWFDRGNCCGSGSGYGYGCTGSSAYACFGSTAAYSCFGGPAVSYTPVFDAGQSCYGGPIPSAPAPTFDPYPGYPTTPATPFPATPNPAPPAVIPYAPPEAAPGMNPNTGLKPAGYTGSALVSNGNTAGRATVIVRLPVDARLFADARQLSLTGTERKFVTPELPANQEFTYRFRIEYDRDGETVSVTKKVPVRAGGTVTIEFSDLTAKVIPEKTATGPVAAAPTSNPTKPESKPDQTPVNPAAIAHAAPTTTPVAPVSPVAPATDRATITVKMPPGATLYVNDRRSPSSEAVRQFSTPPLPAGREFAYQMKAEIVRNGQTETFTQKVPFRAGERVEVDFTTIGR